MNLPLINREMTVNDLVYLGMPHCYREGEHPKVHVKKHRNRLELKYMQISLKWHVVAFNLKIVGLVLAKKIKYGTCTADYQ